MLLLINSRLTLLPKHQGFMSFIQHAGLCELCLCKVWLTIMRFFSRCGMKLWKAEWMVKCVHVLLVLKHKWSSSTSRLVFSLGHSFFITLTTWARLFNTRHCLHPKVSALPSSLQVSYRKCNRMSSLLPSINRSSKRKLGLVLLTHVFPGNGMLHSVLKLIHPL